MDRMELMKYLTILNAFLCGGNLVYCVENGKILSFVAAGVTALAVVVGIIVTR